MGLTRGAPVLEKAPDFRMNLARAEMPFLEPRIVGRNRCFDAFSRTSLNWVYLGQSCMTCALDSGVRLSHGQVWGSGELGRKVRRNSPRYACPVLHCRTLPNTSRLFFSSTKCLVGFRDGFSRLAIANLPEMLCTFQSFSHSFVVVVLDLLLAFDLEAVKGIWHLREVASFASESALSFPGMSQWLGHHATDIERRGCESRREFRFLIKLSANVWAGLGFGLVMGWTAEVLSEEDKSSFMRASRSKNPRTAA